MPPQRPGSPGEAGPGTLAPQPDSPRVTGRAKATGQQVDGPRPGSLGGPPPGAWPLGLPTSSRPRPGHARWLCSGVMAPRSHQRRWGRCPASGRAGNPVRGPRGWPATPGTRAAARRRDGPTATRSLCRGRARSRVEPRVGARHSVVLPALRGHRAVQRDDGPTAIGGPGARSRAEPRFGTRWHSVGPPGAPRPPVGAALQGDDCPRSHPGLCAGAASGSRRGWAPRPGAEQAASHAQWCSRVMAPHPPGVAGALPGTGRGRAPRWGARRAAGHVGGQSVPRP